MKPNIMRTAHRCAYFASNARLADGKQQNFDIYFAACHRGSCTSPTGLGRAIYTRNQDMRWIDARFIEQLR
jgi:hypothetical protein